MRCDQVGWIEQFAAVIALVAPRLVVAAVRAGSLDVAVRQETLVVDGVDHLVGPLLDQAVGFQLLGEVLGQAVIGRVGAATEPVPAEAEGPADVVLQHMVLVTIGLHVLAGLGGGQFGRRAVLVGGADVQGLIAPGPLEAREHVRRQHRSGQGPQMLDAVDVRQGGGDEDAGHGAGYSRRVLPWEVGRLGERGYPDGNRTSGGGRDKHHIPAANWGKQSP